MPNLITKGELAELAGVSRPAVSQAIKDGRLLHALEGSPEKVNLDHPETQRFLQMAKNRSESFRNGSAKPGRKSATKKKSRRKNLWDPKITDPAPPPKPKPEPEETGHPNVIKRARFDENNLPIQSEDDIKSRISEIPEDLRRIVDLPLRKIIEIFGTAKIMEDWLKATAQLDKIYKTRLENATKEGTVVTRELVDRGIISPINIAHKSMMTDGARTITSKIYAQALAGSAPEECELIVRDQLSVYIRRVKAAMQEALED